MTTYTQLTKMRNILFVLLISLSAVLSAQDLKYNIEMNGVASNGDYTPFWHISNRQGLGSIDTRSGYVRAALMGTNKISNEWKADYAVDFLVSHNHTSTIILQQAYADISWKIFTLSLGQKERWSTLVNHRLSTGSLVESGNARPIPQVRIEIPEYWDIFGTNGWFTLRGHLAYGWFTDQKWQKDFTSEDSQRTSAVRYHSKRVDFKFGNDNRFPLTFEFGLNMVAQFGGYIYNTYGRKDNNIKNPTRFIDYFKILIPTKGDDSYAGIDQGNVSGNHLGSWSGALTWDDKKWKLRTYYDHVFDDHSQMFWEYGLWTEQLVGVELTLKEFKWITGVAVEYFNLKNQSGPIYHDSDKLIPDQISCIDNNYNNKLYNGWFNYGMIIGTPLITSPIYNSDHRIITRNNRVEAFHLGIEGQPFKSLGYRMLLTKSNNWGSYDVPFKDIKENFSGLFELSYSPTKLKGWSATASFAFDNGDLYNNNSGAMLTVRKSGIIKF